MVFSRSLDHPIENSFPRTRKQKIRKDYPVPYRSRAFSALRVLCDALISYSYPKISPGEHLYGTRIDKATASGRSRMRRRVVAPPPSDFRGRHDKQVPNGIRQAHTIETPPDIRKLVRQMQFRAHRLAGSALSKRLPVTAFSAVVGRSALAGFRPPSRLPRVLLGWSPYKNNHYGARLLASASSASDMSPTAPRSLSQQLKGHGRVVYKSAESVQLAAAKKVIVVGKLDEVRAAAANMNGASEALLEDLKPDSSTSAVAKIETLVSGRLADPSLACLRPCPSHFSGIFWSVAPQVLRHSCFCNNCQLPSRSLHANCQPGLLTN